MAGDVPPGSNDENGARTGRRGEPTPRWVKVFGTIALVVLLLLLALALLRPGLHGPARHAAGVSAAESPGRVVAFHARAGTY